MAFAIDINALLDALIHAHNQAAAAMVAAEAVAVTVLAERAQARPLGGLTLAELVPYSALHQRAGLYVVFDASGPVYVGSCRSQPFLVRLPAHLSACEGDYLNSLAKAARRNDSGASLLGAAEGVADGCSVLLLTANPRWGDGGSERARFVRALTLLERALQDALHTPWNSRVRRLSAQAAADRMLDLDERVNDAEAQEAEHDEAVEAPAPPPDGVADGAPQGWQDVALAALGIPGGTALVVKVPHVWQAAADAAARQSAVLGDWRCNTDRAGQVRAVVGVAKAAVVEAWSVHGHSVLENGRVRFTNEDAKPLATDGLSLPLSVLQARGIRYIS
jgi:hypothetical protein